MCAYFSKAEDGTSEAMREAGREAFVSGKSDIAKMKAIVPILQNENVQCKKQYTY